jgi:hypothetical protein
MPALDGSEWSTSRPGRFTLGKELRYPFNRRLMGPVAGLDSLRKEKYLVPVGIRTPGRPARC